MCIVLKPSPFPVFEELPSVDNASGARSAASLSSAATSPLEGVARSESQRSHGSARGTRVLVASRHLRNDSKTIQLEQPARDLSLEQLKHLALKSVENLDLTVLPVPKCADDESKRLIESGQLRHRRTGSRDLRPPAPLAPPRHKRTSSHHITLEPHELSLQLHKGRSVDQLASTPFDPRV